MKKDSIGPLFKELEGQFDTRIPPEGHAERFAAKLAARDGSVASLAPKRKQWLRPLAIAASFAVLCMLGLRMLLPSPTVDQQVAEISPEISKTQFYFANLIEEQVRELQAEDSPETKQLIDDTLAQLAKLEVNYRKLEQDLLKGGNSKLILSAMITNFQTRIELLKDVMDKVENIKNLNKQDNENYTI
jgi:hypothetical protein